MKLLYIECFAGLTFGMLPGALLDMGLQDTRQWCAALQAAGCRIVQASRAPKSGIDACGLFVVPADDAPKSLSELESQMFAATLSARGKRLCTGVLDKLSAAGVTQLSAQQAAEAVCDVAGTALLLDAVRPDMCMASEVRFGSVDAAAQAVLDAGRLPCRPKEDAAPLSAVGAALIAQLAQEYGPLPNMQILHIGYGAGGGSNDKPLLLRAVLGRTDDTLGDLECSMELLFEQAVWESRTIEIFAPQAHLAKGW